MIVQEYNKTIDFLERQIIEEFDIIHERIIDYNSNADWTKAVTEIFYKIAKDPSLDCKIAVSKLKNADYSEWLYDIVLYKNNSYGLEMVYLVLECEWFFPKNANSYDQLIQDDFEKLLLARSLYRIMVFEGDNFSEINDYFNQLKLVIENTKLKAIGDRYFFCAWNKQDQRFNYKLLIVE